MLRPQRFGVLATTLFAVAPAVIAQTTNRDIRTHSGMGSPNFGLGFSDDFMVSMGDVNDDGVVDYALANPADTTNGSDAGAVRLISGATGNTIWTRLGSAGPSGCGGGDRLGSAIIRIPDVDGDLRSDLAIGSPGYSPAGTCATVNTGRVQLVSSYTNSVIGTFVGASSSQSFGRAIATIGNDLLILADSGGTSVHRYSVSTGALLFNYPISVATPGHELLIDAGDYDGNSTKFEFAIAIYDSVQIIDGVTGGVIDSFTVSASSNVNAIESFAGAGRNSSGAISDAILVSEWNFATATGPILIKDLQRTTPTTFYSGGSSIIHGLSMDAGHDLTGDGLVDVIAVNVDQGFGGLVTLDILGYNVTTQTATLQASITGSGSVPYVSVESIGDVDGNSFHDFAVMRDLNSAMNNVVIMSGGPLATMNTNSGSGCPRAPGGLAVLTPNQLAIPGQSFNHTASNLLGYDLGAVVVGFPSTTGTTLAPGCTLWMAPGFQTLQVFVTGGQSTFNTQITSLTPAVPALVGVSLAHQIALTCFACGSQQVGLSNATTLTIGW